jgi:hypothetical protein
MRRSIPVVAAVAALTIAGCGGSSSNSSSSSSSSGPSLSAFKTGFQSQKATFSKIGTDLQQAITGASTSSNKSISSVFSALAARTTAAAAALRTLKPPAKYTAQVSSLASGFDTVASDLTAVANAAANSDASAAKTAATKLVTDSAAVHSADLALTHALGLPPTG